MDNQTIIVKKIKKGGHGHHGGAWKVAFADFVTAMMAFFLLLWLLASTTKEERAGISEYFAPTIMGNSTGIGNSEAVIDMGGGQEITRGEDGKDGRDSAGQTAQEQQIQQQEAMLEKQRLESLLEELKQAIEQSQALKPFKDQLLLDITHEGLRIQIVDKENRPMFDSGSAELKPYTKDILHELAKTINTVPNRISLTGHTDAALFVSKKNYSNWELSADRANASRRELISGGLQETKIAKVVGLSSMVPFYKEDPLNPVNRRIAIIVMNKAAELALLEGETQVRDEQEASEALNNVSGAEPVKPASQGLVGSMQDLRPAKPTEAATASGTISREEPKPAEPVKANPPAQQPSPPAPQKQSPQQSRDQAVELAPEQEQTEDSVIPLINPIQLPSIPGS